MSSEDVCHRLWNVHKAIHDLKLNPQTDERKFGYFKENHVFIENHNNMPSRMHYCKHNALSHFSHEEYISWLTLKNALPSTKTFTKSVAKGDDDLPLYYDWRSKGKVTSVKNQGQCGGCWAFSATGAIESAYAIKTDNLVNFSEQQLIDCSTVNHGCNGGIPAYAMEYVIQNGIMYYDDYPYVGRQEVCRYQPNNVVRITDVWGVERNEEAMKQTIVSHCPVSIGINASSRSFQFYSSGIYYDPNVNSQAIDHAVLNVGYGQMNGTDFWTIKNSWGPNWGMEGYVLIFRDGSDYLGVTTMGVIPII